jgi:hypothetical protein
MGSQTQLVLGVDPGLETGGLVALDARRLCVLEALSLAEPRPVRAKLRGEARKLLERRDGWGSLDYTHCDLRARFWAQRALAAVDRICEVHGAIDAVAVEAFLDQPSRARKLIRGRWQTPHLIGRLLAGLEQRGLSVASGQVVFQDAGVVKTQLRFELAQLAARPSNNVVQAASEKSASLGSGLTLGDMTTCSAAPLEPGDVVCAGDRLVGNDHVRDAFAHALALALRLAAPDLEASR